MLNYLEMIPGFDLIQFAQTAGSIAAFIVVVAIIFAENGLLIGFFLPGDSVLFTVGFLIAGTHNFKLDINILLAIVILFIAATAGSSVGYLFGRKLGPGLFNRPNSRLFKQENIQKARDFYDKHGGKTIIIARFIPIVRTFVPLVAGITKMGYKSFTIFNLIGGAIWVGGVVYIGYLLGAILTNMGIDIDAVLLPIVALILIVSILPGVYHLLKNGPQRRAIWDSTKQELRKVFSIKIR